MDSSLFSNSIRLSAVPESDCRWHFLFTAGRSGRLIHHTRCRAAATRNLPVSLIWPHPSARVHYRPPMRDRPAATGDRMDPCGQDQSRRALQCRAGLS